ncbi:MAG: anhydro-N-acetylmuramic acid kinase [Bacteroidia bacterium]|nr:anhydro-N-acetylmuramic acid kinase [Bacteroidia bacterium]
MKEFQKIKTIGLMSGTSCDGLDICYSEFSREGKTWNFQILAAETRSYSPVWLERIHHAPELGGRDLILFSKELGIQFGLEVNMFMEKHKLGKPDAIASHGHTIFHEPSLGLTFQAGDGNNIAAITGCKVLFDFRSLDVALGGQGAPLVPVGDRLLFSTYDSCLNLGGIANLSFEKSGQIIAFDICPFNLLLNHFSNKLGYDYDTDGNIARAGEVNDSLLEALIRVEYNSLVPPKSLGREYVEVEFLSVIDKFNLKPTDILRTLVQYYVTCISSVLDENAIAKVLITGGGVYNRYFVELLRMKTKSVIEVPEPRIIEFKEALIFGFLGCLKLNGFENVWSSVTGSSRNSISGLEVN